MSKWQKMVNKRKIKVPSFDLASKKMIQKEIVWGGGGQPIKKMVPIVVVILLQMVLFGFLYYYFLSSFQWFVYVAMALSVLCSFRVMSGNKNPSSKMAWIMFLCILSPFAFIIYIIWGELSASPLKIRRLRKIYQKTKAANISEKVDISNSRVEGDCVFLQNCGGFFPLVDRGSKYFPMGAPLFEDILKRIEGAKKYIFLEFFIISEGKLLSAFLDLLEKKAAQGVDVRIIFDGLGSKELSGYAVRQIRKAGIKIKTFEKVYPLMDFFINYRDHRKIVVVDGETAYTGGANLADEYINAREKHVFWKDAGIRIDGEGAKSFALMFLRLWEFVSRKHQDYDAYICREESSGESDPGAKALAGAEKEITALQELEPDAEKAADEGSVVLPFCDSPHNKYDPAKGICVDMIMDSKKYCYIMTPYFVVDDSLLDIIKNKALSGADVRIIVPGVPDKKIVYSITMNNLEKLALSGVKVFKYSPGFIHSKVILSDDECALVSSINFDFRSFHQQNECGVYLDNPQTLAQIKADFEDTFTQCEEVNKSNIKKPNFFKRLALAGLRIFAPFM